MNTDWSISTRPSFTQNALNALSKERWSFLITLMVLLGLSGVVIRRIPFTYSAKAKVLIEYPRSTEQLTGLNNQVELGRLDAVGEKVNPINNQVLLLGSYPTFKKALNQLSISEATFPYVNLTVDSVKGTDLIEVSYQSPSPQVAAAITQAIVGVYVQDNLLINRNKGSSARKFLQMRLPELKNQLKEAQDKLEEFQTQNRFLGTVIETDALTKTLIDLKAQVNTAQVQLAFTAEKVARLKAQLPTDLDASVNAAGVSQDIGYQQLQTKLLQAEADLVDLQVRFTNVNPQVVSARNKRDQLKALIQEHSSSLTSGSAPTTASIDPLRQRLVEQWIGLESERSAQVSQLSKLNQQLRQIQQQSEQLPLLIKQQTRLQMAVEAAQQEYLTFKEKFTTSQIAEQQNISNVRVVESANINFMPVAPNLPLLYAIALVVSTGTSLLLVWLLQRRNDVIDGVLELKETLPIPILATIPWSGDGLLGQAEVMLESSLGHSYQLLQAHIRMLPQNVQVVAVCSGVANEGRSSVATNLATIEAHSGQRVLLIDAHGSCEQTGDRYNGSFGNQKVVEQTGDHCLDNGSNQEALLNFDILPTGDTPSPFFYKKWLALLEQSREQYDLIIVDCPPVLDSPDATILASMCDGVLWVARPERLGRRSAAACLENLHTWNTRLLGQVVVGAEKQLPLTLARDDYFEKSSQPSQLQLWQQVER